jgi:hypothetical protein
VKRSSNLKLTGGHYDRSKQEDIGRDIGDAQALQEGIAIGV